MSFPQEPDKCLCDRPVADLADPDGLGDIRNDELWITDGRQGDEPDVIPCARWETLHHFDRQPGLTGASGADQGQHPHVIARQERGNVPDRLIPSDECCEETRKPRYGAMRFGQEGRVRHCSPVIFRKWRWVKPVLAHGSYSPGRRACPKSLSWVAIGFSYRWYAGGNSCDGGGLSPSYRCACRNVLTMLPKACAGLLTGHRTLVSDSVSIRSMRSPMNFDTLHACPAMQLVFPESLPELAPSLPLLRAEKAEFEALFGIPVAFVDDDPGHGPRWLIRLEPERDVNMLVWDPEGLTLTSYAKDADGLMTTFNQVHSLVSLGVERVTDAPEVSTTDAAERIRKEGAGTLPGFGIRGLDWDGICERHVREDMTVEHFERWVAALEDAHTAIRRPVSVYNPPYAVELTARGATVRRVPEGSPAWEAGVRPGWALEIDDPAGWIARNGAPAHARGLTAGR